MRAISPWLPKEAQEGKTLVGTIRDALIERNLSGLRDLQPFPAMPKRDRVELCRRLAVHYGFLIAAHSGPELNRRFKDGWHVLAGWTFLTDTALQIVRPNANTSQSDKIVKKLAACGFASRVEVVEGIWRGVDERMEPTRTAINGKNLLQVSESGAQKIADALSAGSSLSSWKHYRTDGFRLLFDIHTRQVSKMRPRLVAQTKAATGARDELATEPSPPSPPSPQVSQASRVSEPERPSLAPANASELETAGIAGNSEVAAHVSDSTPILDSAPSAPSATIGPVGPQSKTTSDETARERDVANKRGRTRSAFGLPSSRQPIGAR